MLLTCHWPCFLNPVTQSSEGALGRREEEGEARLTCFAPCAAGNSPHGPHVCFLSHNTGIPLNETCVLPHVTHVVLLHEIHVFLSHTTHILCTHNIFFSPHGTHMFPPTCDMYVLLVHG